MSQKVEKFQKGGISNKNQKVHISKCGLFDKRVGRPDFQVFHFECFKLMFSNFSQIQKSPKHPGGEGQENYGHYFLGQLVKLC